MDGKELITPSRNKKMEEYEPNEIELKTAKQCLMDMGLTEDEAEREVEDYYDLY